MQNGATAAAQKYSAKLSTKINESIIHGIKRAYLEARGQQDDNDNLTTEADHCYLEKL